MEEGSVRGATQGEAVVGAQNDLPLLTEEKFDFDLSLSSSSANEDDEVFFGPVGHRERCVAAGLELQGLVPAEPPPWSPLVGEQFQEIFREAHLLALQIKSSSKKAAPGAPEPGLEEDFVQEARLKLDIFERGLQARQSPLALKRETYCVPTPEAGPVRAALSFADSPGAPEPAPNTRLQSQGTAEKGAASRLQPPRPSSALGKGGPAKPQPGRQAAPPRPPATGSRASLGAGPSDQSGSAPGLPASSKFGARRILMKPPGPPRALPGRTSSSGSSSLGTPARGKAKLSEAFGRLPDTPRPKPSGGNASCPKQSQAAPCAAPCATLCAPRTRESASVSLKQSQMPQTGIRRPSSLPSLSQLPKPRGPSSGAKVGPLASNPPQAAVPSAGDSLDTVTPRGQGLSRRPSRPSFGSSAPRATPARCSSVGALQPPALSTRTPLSVRRLSALPTPSGCRVSALPVWPTPRTGPRATSPPRPRAARPPSRGPPRKAEGRPEQAQEVSRPGTCPTLDSPGLAPLALSFASPEQMVPEAPKLETPRPEAPKLETPRPEAPKLETLRLETPRPETPKPEAVEQREATPALSEAVLVHIGAPTCPAPAPPPPCRPLIDFSESPEAGPRRLPLTPLPAGKGQLLIDLFHSPGGPSKPLPVTGQLIDLSSPLICLSPLGEDKENCDSPLLKF